MFHIYEKSSETVSKDLNSCNYMLRATKKNQEILGIFIVWPFKAFAQKSIKHLRGVDGVMNIFAQEPKINSD